METTTIDISLPLITTSVYIWHVYVNYHSLYIIWTTFCEISLVLHDMCFHSSLEFIASSILRESESTTENNEAILLNLWWYRSAKYLRLISSSIFASRASSSAFFWPWSRILLNTLLTGPSIASCICFSYSGSVLDASCPHYTTNPAQVRRSANKQSWNSAHGRRGAAWHWSSSLLTWAIMTDYLKSWKQAHRYQ